MAERASLRPWKRIAFVGVVFAAAFALVFAGVGHFRALSRRVAPRADQMGASQRREPVLEVNATVLAATTAALEREGSSGAEREVTQKRLETLGQKIFDATLSEPAGTSCASCHEPAHGYAGNHGSPNGVAQGSRAGHFARRSTPSLLYLKFVRPFHFHWEEDAPLPDAAGGFFWDGRSDSLASLVQQPLLNPDEMGNPSLATLAAKLERLAYAEELHALSAAAAGSGDIVLALGRALEAFMLSRAMAPFSSKYDEFVRGRTQLSPTEALGLQLFRDPAKGNCASCHRLNERVPRPERSLFTDYGYEIVAVPRRRELPAGARDLGLCERQAPAQLSKEARFCGGFRTPSLRNVALRPSYMHNGAFASLREVVEFYATRGTDPNNWDPHVEFDDLPAPYRQYVNVYVAPYDRKRGQAPRLAALGLHALVAFLETLSDTQIPSAPSP